MSKNCVIALDLGTTAFKCAVVNEHAVLAGPVTVNYALEYDRGLVTCRPDTYTRVALEALSQTAQLARRAGLSVDAIGISSQAQTYIPLDSGGKALRNAVVWTDDRAVAEALEVDGAIKDFAQHSGMKRPLSAMFMPKVLHFTRHSGIPLDTVWKFLLLNEYIIYYLTGEPYGDTTNQGMSGFYHITLHEWSPVALHLAGISAGQLAGVAPAAQMSKSLRPELAAQLDLDPVPVYSCGNDQSCAAVGAGLPKAGDVLCNFGTAMVVYAMKDELPADLLDKQIAGINPLTGRFFLLGVEAECGNVLDWTHRVLYAGQNFPTMMTEALQASVDPENLPLIRLPGGGRIDMLKLTIGHERKHIVRALLEFYADTFGFLLAGVAGSQGVSGLGSSLLHCLAAGGLSRSADWLAFLSHRFSIQFSQLATEQPGLLGIAQIIQRVHSNSN